MTYLLLTWRPRTHYILRNKTSGKKYVGQTTQDLSKYLGSGPHWINHCKKHGGYNRANIEIVWHHFFICEKSAQQWLDQFALDNPNYDTKSNEDWANDCLENTLDNPFYDGEMARRNANSRVADGTHHFLNDNNPSRKKVADGTHHWLGNGSYQREVELKRVADGTHPFLGGQIQSASNQKRVANGTHHFLNDSNPVHKKIEDGTHLWLGPDHNNRRVENGTHPFLNKIGCYDKNGQFIHIQKEFYYSQTGSKDSWEYVTLNSKEGKRRSKLCLGCD